MSDKPLLQSTVGEFAQSVADALGTTLLSSEQIVTTSTPPRLVYGMQGLADLLGCSLSTANRIKRSGVLDAAISQRGKVIITNVDLALDLLRISNRKRYVFTKNCKK